MSTLTVNVKNNLNNLSNKQFKVDVNLDKASISLVY